MINKKQTCACAVATAIACTSPNKAFGCFFDGVVAIDVAMSKQGCLCEGLLHWRTKSTTILCVTVFDGFVIQIID